MEKNKDLYTISSLPFIFSVVSKNRRFKQAARKYARPFLHCEAALRCEERGVSNRPY
ncbi:MAG: hypothetical protein P8016_06530 [Sedimentisphaerales bacterium]